MLGWCCICKRKFGYLCLVCINKSSRRKLIQWMLFWIYKRMKSMYRFDIQRYGDMRYQLIVVLRYCCHERHNTLMVCICVKFKQFLFSGNIFLFLSNEFCFWKPVEGGCLFNASQKIKLILEPLGSMNSLFHLIDYVMWVKYSRYLGLILNKLLFTRD